ncbi:hypothetical protein GT204_09580 [Streptomyces sp. SID4919]|uniref:DUF6243 family protein n=1 Tax=unclassified Streptomyces TaxID=2593676 RepID=UPI0008237F0A|nr:MULTISPECIES: DUF6243 family protein [unclassified Streptomyces]MYY09148.1 hypothetical protein [Streptomyces sp. SID4919]SCK29283.1 hypothetical protein YW7DRAFT_02304 [Streptomyces sp. AmelKG-E11A]
MARNGNMLGVGGTRSNLSRGALRGKGRDGRGAAVDPAAQKRELLRKLQAARTAEQDASAATSGSAPDAGPGPATDEDTTATDGS